MFYVAAEIFWLFELTPRTGETFETVAASPAEFKVLVLSVPVAAVGLGIDVYLSSSYHSCDAASFANWT